MFGYSKKINKYIKNQVKLVYVIKIKPKNNHSV